MDFDLRGGLQEVDDFFGGGSRGRSPSRGAAMGQGLLDELSGLGDLVDAHENVDFGEQLGEFFAETLGQTTGDDQALVGVRGFAELGGLEDGVHAFLLGGIDKGTGVDDRSEEHTSELQSLAYLVCRLLLE